LTGGCKIDLTFTPAPLLSAAPGPDAPPPLDPDAPSIYTALPEQLGLKLEGAKGPMPVFRTEGFCVLNKTSGTLQVRRADGLRIVPH
jgi:uncharacterized protein (TIGR03435 family)